MPASQTGTFRRAGHTGWSAFRFKDPTFPVWLGAAHSPGFFDAVPFGRDFSRQFVGRKRHQLSRYLEVFTNEQFLKAIWNTLIISTWVGAISVIVGALLAWLVTRTDLPLEKIDPRAGHGIVRYAAVLGGVCLDASGRAQCRFAE